MKVGVHHIVEKCLLGTLATFTAVFSNGCSYQNSSDPLSPASEQLSSDGTSHSKVEEEPASVEFDVETFRPSLTSKHAVRLAHDGQSYIRYPLIWDLRTNVRKANLEIPNGIAQSHYASALVSRDGYSRWISLNSNIYGHGALHLILYDESGSVIDNRVIEDVKSFNKFSFSQNRAYFSVNGHRQIEIYSSHDLSKIMSIKLPEQFTTQPPMQPRLTHFTTYDVALSESGDTVLLAADNMVMKFDRNSEGGLTVSTLEKPCDEITPTHIGFLNAGNEVYYYSDGVGSMCLLVQGSVHRIEGIPTFGFNHTVFFDDDDQLMILVNNNKGDYGNVTVYDLTNFNVMNIFEPDDFYAKILEQNIRDRSRFWDDSVRFYDIGRYDEKNNLLILETNAKTVYLLSIRVKDDYSD